MKIIVAIDGPKNEWHPSVAPLNDLLEEEYQIETTNALSNNESMEESDKITPPESKRFPHGFGGGDVEFKPLHAITMHLTESPIVTFYVCQQILVLRGMPFYDAIEKAKTCIDKEDGNYLKYDNYDNIVKAIKKAADMKKDQDKTKTYTLDENTEIIFLHPSTNGGVAHNRNMIIHYVYTHMDDLKKKEHYTHFHFLDNSGQFGRVGQDKLKKSKGIKSTADKETFQEKTLVYPKNNENTYEAFEFSDKNKDVKFVYTPFEK